MSEDGTANRGGRGRAVRLTMVVVGATLLLAAAVVLYLAYADDLRYEASQRDLGSIAPASVSVPSTITIEPTATLDLTGWDTEDLTYWRTLHDRGPFGRLVAPDAGIDAMVVKGAETADLSKGPGWIVQTDPPGAEGNCGISGHRVTHGHPFRNLDRLKVGAAVDLYSPYRRYSYVVDEILRVTPDHVEVVAHTDEPRLTLTTCDPPGDDVKRLVVRAKLVSVERVPTPFGK